MYIFHGIKMIYIRVPKTGSNSFLHSLYHVDVGELDYAWKGAFREAALKTKGKLRKPGAGRHLDERGYHWTAQQAKKLIDPKIWESYDKIASIRHPYTWIKSFYRQPGILEYGFNEDNSVPFTDFLRNLKLTPFNWYTDMDGGFILDRVFKMEEMDKELDKYKAKMVHHNISSETEHQKHKPDFELTIEHKAIIDKKFKRELEYYE